MESYYYYILVEINTEGFVLWKDFTDRRKATNKMVELGSYFYHSEKSEGETLKELKYIERYTFPLESTVISMRDMIYSEGKQVNSYLIKSETEIIDFTNFPRVDKTAFDNVVSECDFPF